MFPVINLGPLSLPSPAFILILGYLAGSYLLDRKAKSFSIDPDLLDRALWIGTASAILGARLSYILSFPAAFKGNLASIISLNPALLDPAGGLAIGFAAVVIVVSHRKIGFWKFLDGLTPFLAALLPAYFLSRFASGSGFGLATDLPWGIFLWGALRHPVQLYLAAFATIPLAAILLYAPPKNMPSGSTFLLFSSASASYYLFLTAFQEPGVLAAGFRIEQIVTWIILLVLLVLLNYRIQLNSLKEHHEINK
jgi:phosphatidylglycerol:prolipoprotein diacylglycerol transferase